MSRADKEILNSADQVFIEMPQTAGINNRAVLTYRCDPDGREMIDDGEKKIIDDDISLDSIVI